MKRFRVEFNIGDTKSPRWVPHVPGKFAPQPSFDTEAEALAYCDARAIEYACSRGYYRVVDAGETIGEVLDRPVDDLCPAPPSPLPSDSAARKEIPVCTGCLDYAPDAFCALVDLLADGEDVGSPDSNDVLVLLPCRGGPRVTAQLAQVCLDLLMFELTGTTHPGETLIAKRWGAALAEVSRISKAGNDKHNPGEPLHHARGKSVDHADCIARHTLEEGGFDGEFRHSACRAWRALMLLQEECEADGCPLARAAWLPDGTKGSDRYAPGAGEEAAE